MLEHLGESREQLSSKIDGMHVALPTARICRAFIRFSLLSRPMNFGDEFLMGQDDLGVWAMSWRNASSDGRLARQRRPGSKQSREGDQYGGAVAPPSRCT
jgi:hypothetical protein